MPEERLVSAIILTLNEELHLERCIRSIESFCKDVFVVDSGSTDATREIAESLGAVVLENEWINYAKQFNWAIDNAPIDTQWVMRIDADEYATPELAREIQQRLPGLGEEVTAVNLRRRVHFMGRWIRYGSYYPTILLRIWRHGRGRCEDKWMDEHIQLDGGSALIFEHDFVDDNLHDLTWWTEKHNGYATREAVDLLNLKYGLLDDVPALLGGQAGGKRWIKENVYARIPRGIRAGLYTAYRYFLRLGFLDGTQGFFFHFLQGFWYRFLVDAKVWDIERRARERGVDVKTVLIEDYGVRL
jgi:glycosyltransferase involved in cell wall biosynthesis